MNESRRSCEPRSFTRDEAVTPVLGSIMILGITVVGIAGIMLWGGPAVLRVQEQGAQAAMVGEFAELRELSLSLSVTDTSRIPGLSMGQGTFGIEPGTTIEFGADLDATCRLDVTEVQALQIKFTATGCGLINDGSVVACGGGETCFNIHRVDTDNPIRTVAVASTSMSPVGPSDSTPGVDYTVDVAAVDLTTGGWMFELRTFGATEPKSQVWRETTVAHHWQMKGDSLVQLHHEAGAIFASVDDRDFMIEAPPLSEEAFGLEWFWFRMPVMDGPDRSITGKLTQEVSLVLDRSPVRISSDDLYRVRMSFIGDYAESWCDNLLFRDFSAPGTWTSSNACAAGADARRDVQYVPDTVPDELEFSHAYISTSI